MLLDINRLGALLLSQPVNPWETPIVKLHSNANNVLRKRRPRSPPLRVKPPKPLGSQLWTRSSRTKHDEQSVVFRQNVDEFKKEYVLYSKSAAVAKRGQKWKPRCAFVEEAPNSITEQVFKVFFSCFLPSTLITLFRWSCEDILRCTVFVYELAQTVARLRSSKRWQVPSYHKPLKPSCAKVLIKLLFSVVRICRPHKCYLRSIP